MATLTTPMRGTGQDHHLLAQSAADDALVSSMVRDFSVLIERARRYVAVTANEAVTRVYWEIGSRVGREILQGTRADYGGRIIANLGRALEARYGRGFGETNIRRMVQYAQAFPDREAVSPLWRQLSWTCFKLVLPLKDPLEREFYLSMCVAQRWTSRQLADKMKSRLFERTALSKQPEDMIRRELAALRARGEITPSLVLQDPYLLGFLDLSERYSERELESAILADIERFMLELGSDFAFVARQKRIPLDGQDYYLDLLLHHRSMRRLVAVELKVGDFKPGDSGQLELYLRWLDRHERKPGEGPPLGIILCAGKNREAVEYLNLGARGIHVAEYLTDVPPREILKERLHRAIEDARARLAADAEDEDIDPDVECGPPDDKAE